MAPSPRSMWSGVVSLGLLNVPITIAKATSDTREESFKTLCADHLRPLDRTERCGAGDKNCSLAKVKGIDKGDGNYHVLTESELQAIEDSSKSDTLTVLDVQPIFALPMEWATGNYYVRHNASVKGTAMNFALLVAALREKDVALVVKWGNASRERLCVIHVPNGGDVLMLTMIPFRSDCRNAGDAELAHKELSVDPKLVEMAGELLMATQQPKGFLWEAYKDAGLAARQKTAKAVLDGEKPQEKPQKPQPELSPDIAELLKNSIEMKS